MEQEIEVYDLLKEEINKREESEIFLMCSNPNGKESFSRLLRADQAAETIREYIKLALDKGMKIKNEFDCVEVIKNLKGEVKNVPDTFPMFYLDTTSKKIQGYIYNGFQGSDHLLEILKKDKYKCKLSTAIIVQALIMGLPKQGILIKKQ